MLTSPLMALTSRITSNKIVKLMESPQFMIYMLLLIILEVLTEVTTLLLRRIQMVNGIISMTAQLVAPMIKQFKRVLRIYCSIEGGRTVQSPIMHLQLPQRKYRKQM